MSAPTPEPVTPGRSRLVRLPLLIAALGVALAISRNWPTDHEVHVVLGDAAPRVVELRIRYAEPVSGHDDWQREVSFHYAPGRAPRIVDHEPRLVSGEYDVEIDVGVTGGAADRRTVTVSRRVRLDDHASSVDVSSAVRDALPLPAQVP